MIRTCLMLSVALLVLALVSLGSGDMALPPDTVLSALLTPGADPDATMIVIEFRLPRLLAAGLSGAALALAGAITQAVMRNPLAEPGLLGINAGAALAASLLIVALAPGSSTLLPVAGFAGALAMTGAIWALAWQGGAAPMRLILIGIAMAALVGAVITALITFGGIDQVQRMMIWLSGSLNGLDWDRLRLLALWLSPGLLACLAAPRALDLIRLDEIVARSLGQRTDRARLGLIALCALLAGATVSITGPIGFVGLIAPHLARRTVGPVHRRLLPVAALFGAVLVAAADLAGRTALAPAEIPVGLVAVLIGGPFFFWLQRRLRHAAA